MPKMTPELLWGCPGHHFDALGHAFPLFCDIILELWALFFLYSVTPRPLAQGPHFRASEIYGHRLLGRAPTKTTTTNDDDSGSP